MESVEDSVFKALLPLVFPGVQLLTAGATLHTLKHRLADFYTRWQHVED